MQYLHQYQHPPRRQKQRSQNPLKASSQQEHKMQFLHPLQYIHRVSQRWCSLHLSARPKWPQNLHFLWLHLLHQWSRSRQLLKARNITKADILNQNSLTSNHCTKAFASPISYAKASTEYCGDCINDLPIYFANARTENQKLYLTIQDLFVMFAEKSKTRGLLHTKLIESSPKDLPPSQDYVLLQACSQSEQADYSGFENSNSEEFSPTHARGSDPYYPQQVV